ncbi:MAG: dihydroorotate dehydrogenase [bacterium]|nr:dihydroorotate dehydrogenase [bacterium]
MTSDSPNLAIDLGGLKMKNPVTVASGTFGYGQEYDRYFDVAELGAVTTKSISIEPRAGNRPPRIVETAAGMLNAIGLQNVGIEVYLREKAPYLREKKVPVIGNIVGKTPEEFATLAARLEEEAAADAIEANLSCPNVHDARRAKGARIVSQDPAAVRLYTEAIRAATKLPLFIKLTPNVLDIGQTALAAQEGGANGVSLINTLIGMAINVEKRRPKLANIVGGLSGPAIRPVAVKMVWDAARVLEIPIIGMGGICTGDDAVEFLLAGATAVSVGSMSFRQPDAALRVVHGISDYMKRHDVRHVSKLVGAVRT